MLVFVRSILFNILFYLNLAVLLVLAMPTMLMPRRVVIELAKVWARSSLWLLRVVCNTKAEFRGTSKIPSGPLIVAAKHQSIWETFALLPLFDDPVFIVKRELMWIPLFGWCCWKGGMISVDRSKGGGAVAEMTARARDVIRSGRQLIIFPEGTRRAPGAEPRYKYGVSHLYAQVGVPCMPVALNSGVYWGRRSFLRRPGTIRVECLDPIPPGVNSEDFYVRLQRDIETTSNQLLAESRSDGKRGSG